MSTAMTPKPGTVWILRSVDKDRKSYCGFTWPESGPVEAPDWGPEPTCGRGLHGWLRGEGNSNIGGFIWAEADRRLWQIVEVAGSDVVDLKGKVKFPRGDVLFTGPRLDAVALIQAAYPSAAVIGSTATAGDYGTATAGYYGKATAGYRGTATAGDYGTATAGYDGTATAGYRGTATAGDYGTATVGDYGTATAGYRGTATAGSRGTATAGYGGTATAGSYGTATAGDDGILQIWRYDAAAGRPRILTAYVGEKGIRPNTPYRLDEYARFVEALP